MALQFTKHLWISKKSRKTSKKPHKSRLSDGKVFEKHCCRAQTREVGGWGGLSAADDAGGGGVSLESMSRALTCGPCTTLVKQGKITVPALVAHALAFWPLDLVAVAADAPPQLGGVTPHALEVGVSKKHSTTLLLFYVLPKILSKNLPFLRKIQNLALRPCRKQDRRIGGMNFLCFLLIHCEYIYTYRQVS